ncbi:uncharacterized protein LOC107475783 isoform X2 [Arachis duranensis]|uniref:Uncharacterized protein LOC107475783 isoform X2 n=1 Tax=Arachis duranensis TaxID=130453 RepID=A0A9C6TM20_ARADU|nr:uncharacterized protein LOC107475783 isoform X2 [Arachis duranensis]
MRSEVGAFKSLHFSLPLQNIRRQKLQLSSTSKTLTPTTATTKNNLDSSFSMAAMDDGIVHHHDDAAEVGFEEGMLWLPSHVLDEACGTKYSKSSTRSSLHQWPNSKVIVNGGPGMQAIFLGSSQRSCGTGVFLPHRAGTNNFQPTKKPACSPVLLPARVVHALNLNVQALGVHISPPQVHKSNTRCEGMDNNYSNNNSSTKKKSDQKEVSKQCSVISQNQSSSSEIFLPKEWTY